MKNFRCKVLGLLVSLLLAQTVEAASGRYKITDLGTLGGYGSYATAINEFGQVVGAARRSDRDWHAFIWENGSMQDLGTLGGYKSYAYGINDAGQVIGRAENATRDWRAFVWENGANMQDLGTLGGMESTANDINEFGQIVGAASNTAGEWHAFLRENGEMRDLGTLGGNNSEAFAVNDYTQVVGNYAQDAFHWENDTMSNLGGSWSDARDINNAGHIAGGTDYPEVGDFGNIIAVTHAAFWSNGPGGDIYDLGTLGGYMSLAYGINDFDQIVGQSDTNGAQSNAFLWESGAMYNLNDLTAADAGWILIKAHDINNSGQIVGEGLNSQGEYNAFLATPVPEPFSLLLLSSGLLGMGLARWRKGRTKGIN